MSTPCVDTVQPRQKQPLGVLARNRFVLIFDAVTLNWVLLWLKFQNVILGPGKLPQNQPFDNLNFSHPPLKVLSIEMNQI